MGNEGLDQPYGIIHYRKHTYSNILKISPPKTESFLAEAILTSTHNLCFWAEIRKIKYTPVKVMYTL